MYSLVGNWNSLCARIRVFNLSSYSPLYPSRLEMMDAKAPLAIENKITPTTITNDANILS